MEKVDFSSFNKPKYFPMWLCEGDTLKLAEVSDSQLDELDRNIRNIADQFDIDNAVGAELDRIGKILGEERNGNTDRVYRIYLKLRTMLNTADGTVEDIIRFVKFFFSSETVHLVPNYPAGLRILHDGFNDTVDFNRIIKQIVGAGIAYDTRELFNMTENFPFEDDDEKRVHRNEREFFSRSTVYRDGRVLRDGVTVLSTHVTDLHRDGTARRNAEVIRNGVIRGHADGAIATPVYRNSGISDELFIGFARHLSDEWEARLLRNGAAVRDGSETRGGKSAQSFNDTLLFDNISQHGEERFVLADTDSKAVVAGISEEIGRAYVRDGTLTRSGRAYRASDRITDPFVMAGSAAVMTEKWEVSDTVSSGIRYDYFRNGRRTRNGSITRKGDMLIAV